MSNKYIKLFIALIVATTYTFLLIYSSLQVHDEYKSVELREVIEQEKELPRIDITGPIEELQSKEMGEMKVTIKYTSENINFEKYATLKIQGSSSRWYIKKNYTMKLYADEDYSQKYEVDLGWGKERKYVLKANWVDKTHARNIVTARIAAQAQQKYHLLEQTPNNGLIDGYPIEIYANGKFHGLYTINIPKDEWLYNMDKNNENHIAMFAEYWADQTAFKKAATYDSWTSQVGSQTEEKLEKFNRVVDFIINSTDEEFKNSFEEYLDLDSMLNCYVLMQYFFITDNHGKNQVFITYDGIKWYPTLYDLDTSFGTWYHGNDMYDITAVLNFDNNTLYKRINELFPNEIADRYFELRENILTKDNIYNELDKFYNGIPKPSLYKEQNRWGDEIPGYDLSQMKDFVTTRTPILDEYFKNKYTKQPVCIDNSSVYCQLFNNSNLNI